MKRQVFTLTVTQDDKGMVIIDSTNDGFNAMELLGVLQFKIEEVLDQMLGNVKAAKVVRTALVDQPLSDPIIMDQYIEDYLKHKASNAGDRSEPYSPNQLP